MAPSDAKGGAPFFCGAPPSALSLSEASELLLAKIANGGILFPGFEACLYKFAAPEHVVAHKAVAPKDSVIGGGSCLKAACQLGPSPGAPVETDFGHCCMGERTIAGVPGRSGQPM